MGCPSCRPWCLTDDLAWAPPLIIDKHFRAFTLIGRPSAASDGRWCMQSESLSQRLPALDLLVSERPRNVGWLGAAGLLFGDWGTSRLYVLGIAFLIGGRTSFYLMAAMSLLVLAVGWAYTHICRIYPDGGGVYSAARHRNRLLGVVGALMLFADYTVTASLSSLEAFHYFMPSAPAVHAPEPPADASIVLHHASGPGHRDELFAWRSPALWALISIVFIGLMNLLGPKHTSGFAVVAALGMIGVTAFVAVCALPQLRWGELNIGHLNHRPLELWQAFVSIVLALSGVESIANLTGVMKKPVFVTARKSVWLVAGEVALLNLLMAAVMVSVASLGRTEHKEDMLAFLAGHFAGGAAEWLVRIVGGLLLLSATNTAINGLVSITYVMARDGEMPRVFQKLNAFGAPWLPVVLATAVPATVLLLAPDLVSLASLYAIGMVGAISINVSLSVFHPRLRKRWRKTFMAILAMVLIAIEITLALTKLYALAFVGIVLAVGLLTRQITLWWHARQSRSSLLRQAVMEQLTPEALARPRIMLATAGSTQLAHQALQKAREENAALVVCFVRSVALSSMMMSAERFTLDTDAAAQELFADFLELGRQYGVPIIPVYDTGANPAELVAELAALNNVQRVLIGTSRRGVIHQLIKGSFQRTLETLLPPEIPVEVLEPADVPQPVSQQAG